MARRLLALLLLVAFPCVAQAAVNSVTAVWEVRTTGNDASGGCFDPNQAGATKDYSQSDTAAVSKTAGSGGTWSNAANTVVTEAPGTFPTDLIGNCIYLTSVTAGTCTVNRPYMIQAVAGDGSTVTLATQACTVNGTGTTYAAGGAITVNKTVSNYYGGDQKICLRPGTHNLTATWNLNVAPNQHRNIIQGSAVTGSVASPAACNDLPTIDSGTQPVLSTNGAAIVAVTGFSGGWGLYNLTISGAGAIKGTNGVSLTDGANGPAFILDSVKITTFDNDCLKSVGSAQPVGIFRSEITGCNAAAGTAAINYPVTGSTSGGLTVTRSYIHNNSQAGYSSVSAAQLQSIVGNIFANNTGIQINMQGGGGVVAQNTICGGGSHGIQIASTGINRNALIVHNNVFWGNAGTQVRVTAANTTTTYPGINYNAVDTTGTGYANIATPPNDIALTATPFAGACGTDMTLNTNAAGLSVKGAGYPGVLPGLAGISGSMTPGAYTPLARRGGAHVIGGGL